MIHHPPFDTPYCRIEGGGDYRRGGGSGHEIEVIPKGKRVTGAFFDGIFDCGRKIWGAGFSGHLVGNIAVVEFEGAWNPPPGWGKAFIARQGNRLYWLVFEPIGRENYVPLYEMMHISKRKVP
jgi:hypothetical protein